MQQGKTVLITGCSTGIGQALAAHLTAAGWRVAATARRPDTLAGTPAELKLALDVERPESVEQAVAATLKAFGRIDALINNAGFGQFGALEEVEPALLDRVFAVNVHGAVRMMQAVLPVMRQQQSGTIVNLSSVAGRIAIPFMGPYCAAKHALEALSDSLRTEVAPFGIRVVLIEPGAIRTEFENTARSQSQTVFARTDSAYAPYYRVIQNVMARANSTAPGPDAVARVIHLALESRRPRARYQVPASAAWMVRLASLIPDRVFDWGLGAMLRRKAR